MIRPSLSWTILPLLCLPLCNALNGQTPSAKHIKPLNPAPLEPIPSYANPNLRPQNQRPPEFNELCRERNRTYSEHDIDEPQWCDSDTTFTAYCQTGDRTSRSTPELGLKCRTHEFCINIAPGGRAVDVTEIPNGMGMAIRVYCVQEAESEAEGLEGGSAKDWQTSTEITNPTDTTQAFMTLQVNGDTYDTNYTLAFRYGKTVDTPSLVAAKNITLGRSYGGQHSYITDLAYAKGTQYFWTAQVMFGKKHAAHLYVVARFAFF